ncbi:MAG: hypothetical protein A3B74_04010 [Candidatus Kerfeldbacteria bacterium RIFCSPHIGHO2_02_FULL_42_14]|uniref:DUF3048 domain-containing protein n=1 Tax=Candidatus Kerfeldbacteria bacterium RIFCSPHIGHO2_02_FULL_42_14 TaxID=1798540 RepID=A0A1G2AQ65_9BACT|nr:MAG: hypothetical protein A3B74_04010 [Candidatus Kerfeldbacteria bacterium RIFCSPHIGHO2_02_FULL_42_14]OGY80674.1 MAG: hypothetical protein A3E60_04505 [Candidatus Kerfeldbacteria bacterium RIFCSPHIGHO2_12_FULL_42_13]OGY82601.1 MAG: hypothetical protein A3I91_04170 [Candidatus Kerfeldbacteria bacterium RIFCSPLOWO2_02_FULL_42_19]OGY85204.1 MAG: hypothetical protein A3G01_01300 [Candidatus Kerfeldbacteria bacterium RIFCSPLOWO2_12_FULL_43_9]
MNKLLHIFKQAWWKIKENTTSAIIFLIVFLILIVILVGFFIFRKNDATLENTKAVEIINTNTIETNETTQTSKTAIPYTAVIENLVDIRPQSGLQEADVVYEALVEGGITRFLAVYKTFETPIKTIGPIRSARPYFIEWTQEYGGIFAHAGGSLEALNILQTNGIIDIDQIGGDQAYFWRTKESFPPHNLFTSSELLAIAAQDNKVTPPENDAFEAWQIKTEEPIRTKNKKEIVLDFSTYNYEVRYIYNPETNAYARSNGGKAHLDKNSGEQLQVKNIIVQRAQTNLVDPRSGLLGIQTEGAGDAFVFLDGKKIEGRWEHSATKQRTYFYDTTGKSIALNPGSVWIEVIPPDRDVLYTQK